MMEVGNTDGKPHPEGNPGAPTKEAIMFGKNKQKKKDITLDDVVPAHPDEYPAKHLKEKLDSRRETLDAIKDHNPSEGLQDTSLGADV